MYVKNPGTDSVRSTSTRFVMISGAETPTNEIVAGIRERRRVPAHDLVRSRAPLAAAVRTKSSSIASRVTDSVSRRHIAPSGAASTSHGTSSCRNQSHGAFHGCTQRGSASKNHGSGTRP